MSKLTHINDDNRPAMVDVTEKDLLYRVAKASGKIKLNDETIKLIAENKIRKGNVLITAELAGVQSAKRTFELIPLCHIITLTKVNVKAELNDDGVSVSSEVKCIGQTGVEMEALTAVSVALLTIYDMCKAVDKKMEISNIILLEKHKLKQGK